MVNSFFIYISVVLLMSGVEMSTTNDSASSFLPNLASPLLGANIVFATDEWFASAGSIILYPIFLCSGSATTVP